MFAFYPRFVNIKNWLANGNIEQFNPSYTYSLDIEIFNVNKNNSKLFGDFVKDVPLNNVPNTFFKKTFPNALSFLNDELIIYITDFTSYVDKQPLLDIIFEASYDKSNNYTKTPISFQVKKSLQIQDRKVQIKIKSINQCSISFNLDRMLS